MYKLFFNSILSFVFLLFAWNTQAQTTASKGDIEIIQFHSEHRCVTCLKIEGLTKSVAQSSKLPFKLMNVDDKKNEKMAEKFEAAGTAVYLYNSRTDKKKDLTDFAFMNAHNKDKFIEGLKKEIAKF